MNRIYRLVFNRALGRVQVASELASGSMAGSGAALPSQRQLALRPLWLPLLMALWVPAGLAATLPTGGSWSTGAGTITPNGANALTVDQTSAKAIIDWASFDIGNAHSVTFMVPVKNAVTVNRIHSGTPSTIAGMLNSHGQVFLINPAGIVFSAGSSVNVGGLVASTMTLDGGVADDVYDFQGSFQAGAQIINQGTLSAPNGSISLLGAAITNGGSIQAAQINLLAANQAQLQFYEPGIGISYYLASIGTSTGTAFGNSAINNSGTLKAGAISLKAAVAPGLLSSLINVGGLVTAGSLSGNDGSLLVQARGGGIVQTGDVYAGAATLYAEGDVTQNSGALSAGTLQFTGPLQNVSLGSATNRIHKLGGTVQGNLVVGNSIALAQFASLHVGGATTVQTNSDIELDNPGNAFGGIVSLAGNNVYISDAAMLRFGTLNVSALIARAPQLRLSGPVTTLGYQRYDGDLLLERDTQLTSSAGTVDFSGRVDGAYALGITARGLAFAGDIGGVTALSSFDTRGVHYQTTVGGNLNTTGNIAFGAIGLRGGNYTVRSTDGSITVTGLLDAQTDGRGRLTLDARDAVSLEADAGASRRLQSLALEGATVSAHAIRVSDTLTVDSGSAYTQQGTYEIGGHARFVADGNITLDNAANRFGGTLWLDGDAAIVDAASTLALDGIAVDSLRATSVAGLTLANARVAGDAALTGSALSLGTFDIDGDLSAHAGTGGLVFGAGRVGGSLTADSGATIGQAGALDVDAAASFDAVDAIAMGHAGNRFGGDVGARAGAGVVLRGQDTLRVVDLASGAGSNVDLAGGILELATAVTTGMGRVTLRSETGVLALGHALGGGAVSLHGANGLVLGADVSAAGALALSSGVDIVQTGGRITAGGAATLDAGRDMDLRGAGNDFRGRVHARGRNVALHDSTTLVLGQVDAASLDVQAATIRLAPAITTSGDQTYRGGVVLDADAALDSASGDIAFIGTVDSTASGRHTLTARAGDGDIRFEGAVGGSHALAGLDAAAARIAIGGALTIDDGNGGGTLSLASERGGIAQSAAFQVTGDTRLATNGGAITLTRADNDFGGKVDLVGAGAVAITDRNALAFGSVSASSLAATSHGALDLGTTSVSGALRASSGGELRLTGMIRADTIDLAAGGRFVNEVGSTALDVSGGTGQWRIFLDSPMLNHQFNGLDSGNTALWNTPAFATPTAGGNRYLFAYQPLLTVTGANLRKTYGDALDLSQAYIVSGAMQGVTGAYKTDQIGSVLGGAPLITSAGSAATAHVSTTPYALWIGKGSLDSPQSGYALRFIDGTLQVDPRALTITANHGGKTYGQTGGLNGYQLDGLLNGDTVGKVDLASAGSSAMANVGNYVITASNADGAGLSNYDITYVNGILSIGKAGLTITANDARGGIGQTTALSGHAAEGLLNGDAIDSVVLRTEGDDADARPGRYAILASDARGARLGNYDIRYRPGTLDIVGVWPEQARQVARDVAANLPAVAVSPLAEPSTTPMYRMDGAAIRPAEDRCTSLGGGCLRQPPE
ncbi:filamentous hemagglutinin N-terminal domain-containing protein [Stenotrophomonas sp. SRS1]|uniref:two-partner secretion domain-containing protein n=1 Tax=Stenotrophomonas sp. SRS1 TaxID=2870345 RepID=UPI002238E533|nr:MBG domain-containing protein [Stenotrophomonas sp. SRS1]MCW6029096.1 filamentous hemagglutinin N-terminal domain-containing protein [Stenotrophomonas sp. SRS1]